MERSVGLPGIYALYRKWTQSHAHTHTRPSSYAGMQRAHLDPLFLSCVSTGSPRTSETESVSCWVTSHSLRPVDCSPLGASVRGILRARILEWVAVSFSGGSYRPEPGLMHRRWILCHLSNWGSPDIQNGIIRTPISNIFIFLSVVPRSHWILHKSQQNFSAFISSLLFYKWGY